MSNESLIKLRIGQPCFCVKNVLKKNGPTAVKQINIFFVQLQWYYQTSVISLSLLQLCVERYRVQSCHKMPEYLNKMLFCLWLDHMIPRFQAFWRVVCPPFITYAIFYRRNAWTFSKMGQSSFCLFSVFWNTNFTEKLWLSAGFELGSSD